MFHRNTSLRGSIAVLALVLAALPAPLAPAQERPERGERSDRGERGERFMRSRGREQAKLSEGVRAAFRDVVAAASRSTVVVKADGKEVALGTVVAADGWIVTKASELAGEALTCTPRGGAELPARLVGVATQHDLAMLKVDAKNLTAVNWGDASKAEVGQWVAASSTSDAAVAVGVLSVGRRKIPGRSGLIGVALADAEDGGAKVSQVVPESPAEKARLQVDDVIVAVNGKSTGSRGELISVIREYSPGQQVTLSVRRGDNQFKARVTLTGSVGEPTRGETMNLMGGPLSTRSANFPAVLQHDTILKPSECGGPLVRLDGKAIGVNIARAGRVETYALPADVVISLLADLKAGKYAPVTQPAEGKEADDGAKTDDQ